MKNTKEETMTIPTCGTTINYIDENNENENEQ